MAVVTGKKAGFTRGYNMIAHHITTFETCDVSQFAFAAFSRIAAGHEINSSIGGYISRKQLNLRICKKYCFHASCAEQTVTKDAVHLCHTLVFEIGVGCRHCCPAKMDEPSRSFCLRLQMQDKNKSWVLILLTTRQVKQNNTRFNVNFVSVAAISDVLLLAFS